MTNTDADKVAVKASPAGGINWKVLLERSSSVLVVALISASIAGITGSTFAATNYTHELTLLHLLAFTSWFGCSIWVSFIAGLIMFNNLPRHVFGRLQAKLFPAYFIFSALTISIALTSAAALYGRDIKSLIVILATILLNMLYFEPETTRVMVLRHAVERRLETGMRLDS